MPWIQCVFFSSFVFQPNSDFNVPVYTAVLETAGSREATSGCTVGTVPEERPIPSFLRLQGREKRKEKGAEERRKGRGQEESSAAPLMAPAAGSPATGRAGGGGASVDRPRIANALKFISYCITPRGAHRAWRC